ncbi:ribosome silencing factor [Salinibius halmophilus]|uniref:ribosome silencing factor n=1 Tax=Salinibius halmophilus TaxID=1853216 RepID=UPI000E65FAC0|nr:ribosome silencing factor [Salinibius halmophilus]
MTEQKVLEAVIEAVEDMKALDVQVIDVREKTSMMDHLVIATGTSTRHLSAIVANVEKDLKEKGFAANSVEGRNGSDWVLIDFFDVVLHVMTSEARAFYDLEQLWTGARPASNED